MPTNLFHLIVRRGCIIHPRVESFLIDLIDSLHFFLQIKLQMHKIYARRCFYAITKVILVLHIIVKMQIVPAQTSVSQFFRLSPRYDALVPTNDSTAKYYRYEYNESDRMR